jgi:alpha-methylacyl-CoA racemase
LLEQEGSGPLKGIRVIEVASIGPGPFAAMMLADMGADVVRLDRAGSGGAGALAAGPWNYMHRGRPSVGVDLKNEAARELVLRLCESADALIEGFRPGVMERLGLGPDEALARNPRLVYGRMTGYGQDGPMASVAGHDINYISLAGALGAIQRKGERPMFPMNLLGDFGGGGLLLAFGVVCAVLEARSSGQGQVVDAAMVDGVAVLSTLIHALRGAGIWTDEAGTNMLDSGAHFYEVYETADGKFIAVGAIEPQFYEELMRLVGVDSAQMPQFDRDSWPAFKERLAEIFRTKTRDEWTEVLERAEACATPVLGLAEAPEHPHNQTRETFLALDGAVQPAPAPRFSRTPGQIRMPAPEAGANTSEALAAWGIPEAEISKLKVAGAITAE